MSNIDYSDIQCLYYSMHFTYPYAMIYARKILTEYPSLETEISKIMNNKQSIKSHLDYREFANRVINVYPQITLMMNEFLSKIFD